MSQEPKPKAQVIPPDAYPQMASKAQAAIMSRALRSPGAAATATRVIEDSAETLREAVRLYAEELEQAGANLELISDKAHEIRGFAETVGMLSTGRIADGLCRYFDEADQSGIAPDVAVVALHVSAIIRTARDPSSVGQMNDVVAKELAMLAARKLAESRKALKNS
jgi:preprotein translocase subunit Sec61beta